MKLCYRGVTYETNRTHVNIEGKRNVVKFRGCSYEVRQAVVNLNTEMQSELVYRGISVSEGKSARFLGSSYERQQVMLVPSCILA